MPAHFINIFFYKILIKISTKKEKPCYNTRKIKLVQKKMEPIFLNPKANNSNPAKVSPNTKRIFNEYSPRQKRISFFNTLFPFLGFIVAIISFCLNGITTWELILLIVSYSLTIVGVEVGLHRYFSHGAFKTTSTIRTLLAILGSMAGQGPVTYWVTNHRRHHQYADLPGDPHSPHYVENQKKDFIEGFWHAYIGWFFKYEFANTTIFAKDLLRDSALMKINNLYWVWVILGILIPGFIGAIITKNLSGFVGGIIWGGFVRMFFALQAISLVNSVGHYFGKRLFSCEDRSTNNFYLGLLSFGGGWHNNHHAFPYSAVTGFYWWQIDIGGLIIRFFETIGLFWEVKRPTKQQLKALLNK